MNETSNPTDMFDETHPASPRTSSWIGGVVLILLGVFFLLRTTGTFTFPLTNWWALFILIPALGAFETTWRRYQQVGTLDAAAYGSFIVGCVLTTITATFVFHLSWSWIGPVIIILLGLGLILRSQRS